MKQSKNQTHSKQKKLISKNETNKNIVQSKMILKKKMASDILFKTQNGVTRHVLARSRVLTSAHELAGNEEDCSSIQNTTK